MDILQLQRAERDHLGQLLMTALRDAMPFGLEVDLGHERKARLAGINGGKSRIFQQPIYREGVDATADPKNPKKDVIGVGEWQFICDWQLKNCDQDHIEVTVKITGGGGLI